jgi:hypothetical protein
LALNAQRSRTRPDRLGTVVSTILIVLHAAAGVAAFVAGCAVLVPSAPEPRARRQFDLYLESLGPMVVLLAAAMATHWRQLPTAEQVIFGGLLLALFLTWRAAAARRLRRRAGGDWRRPYMEHVCFTLIALWEGFVIVLAIDLGVSGWLVAVLAALGLVAGNAPCTGLRRGRDPPDRSRAGRPASG